MLKHIKRCNCGRPLIKGYNTWCELCSKAPKDKRGFPITPKNRDNAEQDGAKAAAQGLTKDSCPYNNKQYPCMEQQCYRFWMIGFLRHSLTH